MKKKNNVKFLLAIITLAMPKIALASKYVVCDGDKKIPYAFTSVTATLVTLIKIAIPIFLVISGMIAFFKVAASSNVDDEMKKAKSKLINNIIAAVIVFFAFSIVNFAVSLVAGANNKLMKCAQCFIEPDKCDVVEVNTKLCPGFLDGEYDENCNPIKKEEEKKNTNKTETQETSETTNNTNEVYGPTEANPETYINGILIVNKTYSLPRTYKPASATGIEAEGDCKEEKCFTNQTWQAWQSMKDGARLAGYKLVIGSGYRSYGYQANLYSNYVANDGKEAADRYSARPGHSEHQTGLAMDICIEGNSATCVNDGFSTTAEAKWLSENAYKYGFILRYPEGKEDKTGYKYESWHFRYVGKVLAEKLYNNGNWVTLEEYLNITSVYQ